MTRLPVIEEHYILIGINCYQIIFDSKVNGHDILIRGLFLWDPIDTSRINEIDFILDNLSTTKITHIITKALWCQNQNRIELHINEKPGADLRTQEAMPIPKGFDFGKDKELELILRIYKETETIADCEEFVMPRPNDKQNDKDGSILIGTTVPK